MQVREKISKARKASEVLLCSTVRHCAGCLLIMEPQMTAWLALQVRHIACSGMEKVVIQTEEAAAEGAAAVHHRASARYL